MQASCQPHHDWFNGILTIGLILGLVFSYGPQHFRIINKGSSEGFSPWFLLLGSTSSAAGLLNMITMQWGIMKCCRVVSIGNCVEMTGGVIQFVLQWSMFTLILILFIVYYPPHLKYAAIDLDTHDTRPPVTTKVTVLSPEWRLAITVSWLTFFHFLSISLITIYLFSTAPSPSPSPSDLDARLTAWATFLGLSSALLAAIQYCPQLLHTYNTKLVGALSIPMMVIQSPGAAIMVLSIALRPGTNWTSWIMFAVSGIMQAALLIMCLLWKSRQRRLQIDDFGHPLHPSSHSPSCSSPDDNDDQQVPAGLVVDDADDANAVSAALASALASAAGEDVRTPSRNGSLEEEQEEEEQQRQRHTNEATPLLGGGSAETKKGYRGMFGWFHPRG